MRFAVALALVHVVLRSVGAMPVDPVELLSRMYVGEDELRNALVSDVIESTKALFRKFNKVIHVGGAESEKTRLPKFDHRAEPGVEGDWSGTLIKISLDAEHAVSFIDEILTTEPTRLLADAEKSYKQLVEKFETETQMVISCGVATNGGGDESGRDGPQRATIVKHKNCSPALFFDKIFDWPAAFEMVDKKWDAVSPKLQAIFKLNTLFIFFTALFEKTYRVHYHTSKSGDKKHKQKVYMNMPLMMGKRIATHFVMMTWVSKFLKTLEREPELAGVDDDEMHLLVTAPVEHFYERTEIVVREKCTDLDCGVFVDPDTHAVVSKTQTTKKKRRESATRADLQKRLDSEKRSFFELMRQSPFPYAISCTNFHDEKEAEVHRKFEQHKENIAELEKQLGELGTQ